MVAEIFEAVVVSGADPLGQGRIRVVVPQMSGTAVSAWAVPTARTLAPPPAAGTPVWVSLDTGDPGKPVCHYAPPRASNGGRLVCTSTDRPPAPYPGMEIYELDTGNSLVYAGVGGWVLQAGWTPWAVLPGGWVASGWNAHTAQYRTGPTGVQLRGGVLTGVSPVANGATLLTVPSALCPPATATELWWPVTIAPGSATFTVNHLLLSSGGAVQLVGGAVSFSGGNLYVNLSPVSYSLA